MKGSPDIIKAENHKKFNGFCIEFKSLTNNSSIGIKGHYRLFENPQSNVYKIEAKKYFPYRVNKYMSENLSGNN